MSKKPAGAGKSSFDLIDPPAFFSRVKIHPSAQVLDAGCGTGRYSIEISKILDEKGMIHAVDVWEEGLERLQDDIREKNISGINPVKADITGHIPLKKESVDFCLLATVLHDLPPAGQDAALREIARILRPDGVLALVEFKKVDTGPGPPMARRISEREAEEIIERHGFYRTSGGEIGEFIYLLNFKIGRRFAVGRRGTARDGT